MVLFGHPGGVSGAICVLLLAEVSGVGLLGLLQGLATFPWVLVKDERTLCCQGGIVGDSSQVKTRNTTMETSCG